MVLGLLQSLLQGESAIITLYWAPSGPACIWSMFKPEGVRRQAQDSRKSARACSSLATVSYFLCSSNLDLPEVYTRTSGKHASGTPLAGIRAHFGCGIMRCKHYSRPHQHMQAFKRPRALAACNARLRSLAGVHQQKTAHEQLDQSSTICSGCCICFCSAGNSSICLVWLAVRGEYLPAPPVTARSPAQLCHALLWNLPERRHTWCHGSILEVSCLHPACSTADQSCQALSCLCSLLHGILACTIKAGFGSAWHQPAVLQKLIRYDIGMMQVEHFIAGHLPGSDWVYLVGSSPILLHAANAGLCHFQHGACLQTQSLL